MLESLKAKTGHTLEEWTVLISDQKLTSHGAIVKFLKETHGVGHGYAATIGLKVLGTDTASVGGDDELLENQYKGKENLRPLYDALIGEIAKFGGDFEIAPKKAYVALRRKKQFVILNPATKTRFEIGFNLKGHPAEGRLIAEKPDAICSHKTSLTEVSEIDAELLGWIKTAFDKAG